MRFAVVPSSAAASAAAAACAATEIGCSPAFGLRERAAASASAGVSGWGAAAASAATVPCWGERGGGDGDSGCGAPPSIVAGMPGGRVPAAYSGLHRLPATHLSSSAARLIAGCCLTVAPAAWANVAAPCVMAVAAGSALLAAEARLVALMGPDHSGTVGRRLRRPARTPRYC